MAASLRRNISFPAPRPSHPGARRRRQRITNQPSISSPTTAAAVIPRSSTAFGSQRSSEKHPSPQPLPRQIPIDDQALIALPRVPSSEAFGRRSPYTGSNARVGPASETLNGTGHLPLASPHAPDGIEPEDRQITDLARQWHVPQRPRSRLKPPRAASSLESHSLIDKLRIFVVTCAGTARTRLRCFAGMTVSNTTILKAQR
jgi:hypothetical protein